MSVYVINEYRFPCWFETHPWRTGWMTEVAARVRPAGQAHEVTHGIHAALRLAVASRDGMVTALTVTLADFEEMVRLVRRIQRSEPGDTMEAA